MHFNSRFWHFAIGARSFTRYSTFFSCYSRSSYCNVEKVQLFTKYQKVITRILQSRTIISLFYEGLWPDEWRWCTFYIHIYLRWVIVQTWINVQDSWRNINVKVKGELACTNQIKHNLWKGQLVKSINAPNVLLLVVWREASNNNNEDDNDILDNNNSGWSSKIITKETDYRLGCYQKLDDTHESSWVICCCRRFGTACLVDDL